MLIAQHYFYLTKICYSAKSDSKCLDLEKVRNQKYSPTHCKIENWSNLLLFLRDYIYLKKIISNLFPLFLEKNNLFLINLFLYFLKFISNTFVPHLASSTKPLFKSFQQYVYIFLKWSLNNIKEN